MNGKIRKAAGTAARNPLVLIEILRLAFKLERRLRRGSSGKLTTHIDRLRRVPDKPKAKAPLPGVKNLELLITVGYRLLGLRANCLRRSLIIKELYWRRAQPCRMIFGVAHEDGKLLSHAWVEPEGAEPERVEPAWIIDGPSCPTPASLEDSVLFEPLATI